LGYNSQSLLLSALSSRESFHSVKTQKETLTMPKPSRSGEGEPLLFIPYCWKPFLEIKKKVRGKNRQPFELLEKALSLLEIGLDRNEFESEEVKAAVSQFLVILRGAKKVSQKR